MDSKTRLAVVRGQFLKVQNPRDGINVRYANEIPFKCPECGVSGTAEMAADDNPRICEDCYQQALDEIED